MSKNLRYRWLIVGLAVIGAAYFYWSRGVNLGLDLQGGIHLVLQVETNKSLEAEIEQVRDRLESGLQDKEVTFASVEISDSRLVVNGVPNDQADVAEGEIALLAASWNSRSRVQGGAIDYTLEMRAAARKALLDLTVRQVREIILNRIDQYGVTEPTITVYGSGEVQDQIIVELPGVDDFDRVIQLIRDTAKLELKLVHPTYSDFYPSEAAILGLFSNNLPADYEILRYQSETPDGQPQLMIVRKAAVITGQHLKNARRSENPFTAQSEVSFFLNSDGVALFSQATGDNIGNLLSIVLDGQIISAPRIDEKIPSESAVIRGSFTPEEADDLALKLRSGALPAPIVILEQRSVGPSLGLDSIRRGISASILGMTLVVLLMLVVYKLSGINAVVCLALNLLFLVGSLSAFGATLTLPGIAGVILTIGIAVDANILIFERIKEELRRGKTLRSGVESAFARVFSTILDTNITTLVAALFLFQFGTGPVRGFAVTLAAGLLANIFTATFVSRTIFLSVLQNRNVRRLSI